MGRRRADPADRRPRRGEPGREAQSPGRAAVLERAAVPGVVGRAAEETGIDTGYRRTGGVDVAWTDREDEALRAAAGQWRAEGIAYERIPPGDYARVEPALNPELRSVYYLPDRAQVRNPRLLRALIEAASRRGAGLEPHRGVEGFAIDERPDRGGPHRRGGYPLRDW